MTLAAFKSLIVSADPKATRYFGADTGNSTVWAEYERTGLNAENELSEPVWRIRVDRFTNIEDDPVAEAITNALAQDEITVRYTVASDPATRYIRHTWYCEVA